MRRVLNFWYEVCLYGFDRSLDKGGFLMTKTTALFSMLLFCAFPSAASAAYIPDTGQTACYQAVSPFGDISCAGTGQDGFYGYNAMTFNDNGTGTVTDNNTGVMWQKEDDNQVYSFSQAQNACGTLELGGYDDWRVPTKKELMSLVDYSVAYAESNPLPQINLTFFPNTNAANYWASTDSVSAQGVDFGTGLYSRSLDPSAANVYLRCARGSSPANQSLVDNSDGTVTDSTTGLMWHKVAAEQKTWADSLSYCEGSAVGGYEDWRLPNIKELEAWFDDTRSSPAVNAAYFQATLTDAYWTSTTRAGRPDEVWGIDVSSGAVSSYFKGMTGNLPHNVQCVRGGAVGFLSISFPGTGTGAVTGDGVRYGLPVSFSANTALTEKFDIGTAVNLQASPAEFSLFSGWSGSCSGTGDCAVLMDSDKSVAATFTQNITNSIVINGTTTYFSSLQAAYNGSPSGSLLKVWGTEYSENLSANISNKSITIEGGYNSNYSAISGYTTLHGILVISQGSLTVRNLIIR